MADRKTTPKQTQDADPITATAEIVAFAQGVYTVDMPGAGDNKPLPCARIQPLSGGHASALADTELIAPGGPASFLRVPGPAPAQVLVTIYRAAGAPVPELRIRRLNDTMAAPVRPDPVPASAAELSVYVQGQGDMAVPLGAWAGRPGSGQALEGFALTLSALLPEGSLEYQGSLGAEWDTDWHGPGQFCGTRDVALPLIGVRIRLRGAAAERVRCQYWGSFVGYGERGPFADGALCGCAGAALEALRVEFSGS